MEKEKDKEFLEKFLELRRNNKEFDDLVSEVDGKIQKIISERNSFRSFNPKDSNDQCINIKVKAIPLTKKEQQYLLTYLDNQYIKLVGGEWFAMSKCFLRKKYKICTRYDYWRYEDFDFM